jgi:hypothetical protein
MTLPELKYSEVKKICDITGYNPTELPDLFDSGDWSILTDEEADEAVKESISETCVYFNASFLASMTELPEEVFTALQSNDDIETCLKIIEKTCGLDDFVEEAIRYDGRGHFLNGYDGHEHEVGNYFLYQHN